MATVRRWNLFMWLVRFLLSLQLQPFIHPQRFLNRYMFSCPRKINKQKARSAPDAFKIRKIFKFIWAFFFFFLILILRPHSLEISMSLVWVVGVAVWILNCSARPVLFHGLKILKSPTFISVAAVRLVRCCTQVANLQHYPLSLLPWFIVMFMIL